MHVKGGAPLVRKMVLRYLVLVYYEENDECKFSSSKILLHLLCTLYSLLEDSGVKPNY
jgi:hypothetical protein